MKYIINVYVTHLNTTICKNFVKMLDFLTLLSANPTKWPNTPKQFVGDFPTNCLSVFGHFVGLALKGLNLIRF